MKYLLALILLTACNYQVTGYDEQPPMSNGPTRTRVTLVVKWVNDVDEVSCKASDITYVGCTNCYDVNDDWFCTVEVQQPKDFNDVARLATLGHEVFHALGAYHVPVSGASR